MVLKVADGEAESGGSLAVRQGLKQTTHRETQAFIDIHIQMHGFDMDRDDRSRGRHRAISAFEKSEAEPCTRMGRSLLMMRHCIATSPVPMSQRHAEGSGLV
jgi:hypothetical protein